jgi:hypothetical protein
MDSNICGGGGAGAGGCIDADTATAGGIDAGTGCIEACAKTKGCGCETAGLTQIRLLLLPLAFVSLGLSDMGSRQNGLAGRGAEDTRTHLTGSMFSRAAAISAEYVDSLSAIEELRNSMHSTGSLTGGILTRLDFAGTSDNLVYDTRFISSLKLLFGLLCCLY